MIRFSETALEMLHEAVQKSGLENGRCLRLVPDRDQYALTIDRATGWDQVVEHQGKTVLVLAREVGESLGEAVIEAKEDEGALQLIVRKPAA